MTGMPVSVKPVQVRGRIPYRARDFDFPATASFNNYNDV